MSLYVPHYRPGTGRILSITGTNPAAGVEISETVPAGMVWGLRSMLLSLTTDATVTNRRVSIQLDEGGGLIYWRQFSQSDHAASTTRSYAFAPAMENLTNSQATVQISFPANIVFPAGQIIKTVTNNLQAGDDFGAPQMLVEVWFENR